MASPDARPSQARPSHALPSHARNLPSEGVPANSVNEQLVSVMCADVRTMLAKWDAKCGTRPEKLTRKLWLLALEREQLVAVAYRDVTVLERVKALDVPDDLRAVSVRPFCGSGRTKRCTSTMREASSLGPLIRYQPW